MKIYSVNDPEFKPYGRVVTGLETAKAEILAALASTPLPAATDYVPEDERLQELPAAVEVSEHLFGGMPCQLGWCNGHNTYLNCLEYHRDSEFNLGTEDFVLLLARMEDIEDGKLDTAKPDMQNNGGDDPLLWACNKWLLAHAESTEAKAGAYIGLTGENIHI